MRRARVVVETRAAAMEEAGDLLLPMGEDVDRRRSRRGGPAGGGARRAGPARRGRCHAVRVGRPRVRGSRGGGSARRGDVRSARGVPGEGVEPSRAEAHGILSPARLPVPPSRPGVHRLSATLPMTSSARPFARLSLVCRGAGLVLPVRRRAGAGGQDRVLPGPLGARSRRPRLAVVPGVRHGRAAPAGRRRDRRSRWCSSTPSVTTRPRSRWRARSRRTPPSCWPSRRRSGTSRPRSPACWPRRASRRSGCRPTSASPWLGRAPPAGDPARALAAPRAGPRRGGRRAGRARPGRLDRERRAGLPRRRRLRLRHRAPRRGRGGSRRPRTRQDLRRRRGVRGARGGVVGLPSRRVGRLPPGARDLARAMRDIRIRTRQAGGSRRRRAEDRDPSDVAGGRRGRGGLGRVLVRRRRARARAREPPLRQRLPVRARPHAGCLRRRGLGRRAHRRRTRSLPGWSTAPACGRRSAPSLGSEGVARRYLFDTDGELIAARPGLFVAAGTRWLPLPS